LGEFVSKKSITFSKFGPKARFEGPRYMNAARGLLLALAAWGLAVDARAESFYLSCQISSTEGPQQDLIVEVSDGGVRYGPSASGLVEAGSISKFAANGALISFKQNFPETGVVWDWTIDRAAGAITIKYISSANGKTFLTKRGSCR
jgi:hypothetical protein